MIYESKTSKELLLDQMEEKLSSKPNYSANAFARDIGVSKAYLSLLLNGKRKITPILAERISKSLKLSKTEKNSFSVYHVLIMLRIKRLKNTIN